MKDYYNICCLKYLPSNIKNLYLYFSASILVVGQIIGCLIGGPISDIFGRRSSILTFQTISFFGWILVSLAPLFGGSTDSVLILFLGRFIHGLADSMGVSPAIMFIAGKLYNLNFSPRRQIFKNNF